MLHRNGIPAPGFPTAPARTRPPHADRTAALGGDAGPLAHRRRGYVGESVLLWSRSRRCRAAWAEHLDQSRAAVVAACAGLERRRTAVVLGSGLLQDVPLAHLAERFAAVDLVDVVHLWPARRAARAFPHVRLVTADLTGLAGGGDSLSASCGGADVDFVVSANVLATADPAPRPARAPAARSRPADRAQPSRRAREARRPGLPPHRCGAGGGGPRGPGHRPARSPARGAPGATRPVLDLGPRALRRGGARSAAAPRSPGIPRLARSRNVKGRPQGAASRSRCGDGPYSTTGGTSLTAGSWPSARSEPSNLARRRRRGLGAGASSETGAARAVSASGGVSVGRSAAATGRGGVIRKAGRPATSSALARDSGSSRRRLRRGAPSLVRAGRGSARGASWRTASAPAGSETGPSPRPLP